MTTSKICPVCKKEFKGRNRYCCSMTCWAKYKTNIKKCIICGQPFADSGSNDTLCCSRECSRKHRKNLYDQGVNDAALQKAHAALPLRPLTGRFDTHVNAKTWKIQTPDGKIYECRNLKNWLRDHADLLDGTVRQAWDGITKIKYTMQGKRKNPSHQWKGWKLLEWGEG